MNNENNDLKKYIRMEDYSSNWIFYDDDIRVSEEDIPLIKPLTKEYSSILWNKYISSKNRHPMLLTKDEIPLNLITIYNFHSDWEDNKYENLRKVLRKKLKFNFNDSILFFWARECCIETNWGIFLKYWINFLFDDEGPILINPASNKIITFGPSGCVMIGERLEKISDTD